jgi:dimethylaniline monooxygenase (N-oxide forming)
VQAKKVAIHREKIEQVETGGLRFVGGVQLACDALIFCTGYRPELPFLGPDILEKIGFADDPLQPVLLYKTMFPREIPNMAFVGMYRGPFFGVMELQARNVCMTFSGKIPFPTEEEMHEGISEELAIRNQEPRPQFPHGDYVGFCEALAKRIGALPKSMHLSPLLNTLLIKGPFTTASYRLNDMNTGEESMKAIAAAVRRARKEI